MIKSFSAVDLICRSTVHISSPWFDFSVNDSLFLTSPFALDRRSLRDQRPWSNFLPPILWSPRLIPTVGWCHPTASLLPHVLWSSQTIYAGFHNFCLYFARFNVFPPYWGKFAGWGWRSSYFRFIREIIRRGFQSHISSVFYEALMLFYLCAALHISEKTMDLTLSKGINAEDLNVSETED